MKLDYCTAWKLSSVVIHLTDECSYIKTNGAILCDCSAIEIEWRRLNNTNKTTQKRCTEHG